MRKLKDSVSFWNKLENGGCENLKSSNDSFSRNNTTKNSTNELILDYLFNLRRKKHYSLEKRMLWNRSSFLSNNSSYNNREVKKQRILVCLGNNDYGQLAMDRQDSINIVGFSDIFISSTDKGSQDLGDLRGGEVTCVFSRLRNLDGNKRRSQVESSIYTNLSNNEKYNKILQSIPSDLELSTKRDNRRKRKNITVKNKLQVEEIKVGKECELSEPNKDKEEVKKTNTVFLHPRKNINIQRNTYINTTVGKRLALSKYKISSKKERMTNYDEFLSVDDHANESTCEVTEDKGIPFVPKMIRCGKHHCAIISEDGFICIWGLNYYGQLGVNSKKCKYICYKKTKLFTSKKEKGCYKSKNKSKTIYFPYMYKLVPLREFGYTHKVKDVSLGSFHTILLTRDGFVFSFGCNKRYQLGLPNMENTLCSYLDSPTMIPIGDKNYPGYCDICAPVISICCGSFHSGLIDANKNAWLWGWNEYGQVDDSFVSLKEKKKKGRKKKWKKQGNGKEEWISNKYVSIPRKIKVKKKKINLISLGKYHSIGLTEDKLVYIWGCLCKDQKKETDTSGSTKWNILKLPFTKKKKIQNMNSFTSITKVKVLSDLFISNITSSSTHTVFVSPILNVHEHIPEIQTIHNLRNSRSIFNWNDSYCRNEEESWIKSGDLFRYHIISGNLYRRKSFTEDICKRKFISGGDNVYFVKYSDLYHLIYTDSTRTQVSNVCNKYHLLNYNELVHYNGKNSNQWKWNEYSIGLIKQQEKNPHMIGTVGLMNNIRQSESILKPLTLSFSNHLVNSNFLQIFQVSVGKNFSIIITSSPYINKIISQRKFRKYSININTFDRFKTFEGERNLFVVGDSCRDQLFLPNHAKYTSVPFPLDKYKLLEEVNIRNMKNNFIDVGITRRKLSDQTKYNHFMLANIRKQYNRKGNRLTGYFKYSEDLEDEFNRNFSFYLMDMIDRTQSITNTTNRKYTCPISNVLKKKTQPMKEKNIPLHVHELRKIENYKWSSCSSEKGNERLWKERSTQESQRNPYFEDKEKDEELYETIKEEIIYPETMKEEMIEKKLLYNDNPLQHIMKNGLQDYSSLHIMSNKKKPVSFSETSKDSSKLYDIFDHPKIEKKVPLHHNHFTNELRNVLTNITDMHKAGLEEGKEQKQKEEQEQGKIQESKAVEKQSKSSPENKRYTECEVQLEEESFPGSIKNEYEKLDDYIKNPKVFINYSAFVDNYDMSIDNLEVSRIDDKNEEFEMEATESSNRALTNDSHDNGKLLTNFSLATAKEKSKKTEKKSDVDSLEGAILSPVEDCVVYLDKKPDEIDHQKEKEKEFELSKEMGWKKKRTSPASSTVKELVKKMLLDIVDNVNEDSFITYEQRKEQFNSNKQLKSRFKIFKKRNSCLWNYFTYNDTRKKNHRFDYSLFEHIVNVTFLDVACGDSHSMILLEMDLM